MTTTADVKAALRNRYDSQAYALMFEVANATGMNHSRWADAVAVGLWPSRGLTISGFEIKVSRADWLKELKQPAKAEAICKFCHQWWVVAGDSKIVRDDELPPTWGLMVLTGRGLKATKNAPNLSPQQITPAFLAALLRSAAKPAIAQDHEAFTKAFAAGEERAKGWQRDRLERIEKELSDIQAIIKQFQEASGVNLTGYWERQQPQKIGQIVRDVLDGKHDRELCQIKRIRDLASNLVVDIDESGVLATRTKAHEEGDS